MARFLSWARRLEHVSFKRKQYTIFSTLYVLRGFSFTSKLSLAILVAITYELDFAIDELTEKGDNYQKKIDSILTSGHYAEIIESYFSSIPSASKDILTPALRELFAASAKLDSTEISSLVDYLEISSVTIAVPFLAKAVALVEEEAPADAALTKLVAEVVRLINDRSTVDKDRSEKVKNAYLMFELHLLEDQLMERLLEVERTSPRTKMDLFLKRLVSLSKFLYRSKDFEL